MYYLKVENKKIEFIDKNGEEYIFVKDNEDISNILDISKENYIIGSNDKLIIDKCYVLLLFIMYYKKNYKCLVDKMDIYNNELINEENYYIRELLENFKNLNSDGKFIRGFLILLGNEILNKKSNEDVIPLSIAFELFQTSVLIHDDIIDNASLRRGKKTIPTIYQEKYNDAKHLGNSLAICAGDMGFYKANEILIDNYSNNKNLLKYFNDIIINTIKGEILDVILPHVQKYKYFNDNNLEKYVMDIYRLKTSWYSIVGPICVGMILGGATKEQVSQMEDLAYGLGIAFQIKDDILGIYSEKVRDEKTASDISEFKQTILYSYVFDKNNIYLDELNKYYGKDNLSLDDVEKVKNIFRDSGALDYANEMMKKLFAEANDKLKRITFVSEDYKKIIEGFIVYLEQRNK